MKAIFVAITAKLEESAMRWVDEDKGQMNFENPPVIFPAALVEIDIPTIETLSRKAQNMEPTVTVRLCFDFIGKTSNATPKIARDKSLAYYDQVQEVYELLQGFEGASFNPLELKSLMQEKRPDGYKVVALRFGTEFHEFV
jgi:hypothetical protein